MKKWLKRSLWLAVLVALAGLVVRAFQPSPVLVDLAVLSRGDLVISVADDGRTRVRERYTVHAPIGGRLLRTALRAGDPVVAGETLVAEFARVAPALLDARQRGEAEARVGRAEAALDEAAARRAEAELSLAFAETQLERAAALLGAEIKSREEYDRAELERQRAFQGVRAASFAEQVATFELALCRASLLEPSASELDEPQRLDLDGVVEQSGRLHLRSPIDGRVLRVFEESARTMTAGTPILEVGNVAALEVEAEFLSQDAVKIDVGMPVRVEGWGGEVAGSGDRTLEGRVCMVEPHGFTKVSALGVEEQRVVVLVEPAGAVEDWERLGDGYHVELEVELWRGPDRLLVPSGALFRERGVWWAFVVERGKARRREVDLGRRGGQTAEVLGGLSAGEEVVMYPSEAIADGTRVRVR
jgi:HlyD family secretion protein